MKESGYPEIIGKRIEIAKLFYPLGRSEERKWARVFRNGFNSLLTRLEAEAINLKFIQEIIDESYIIWRDQDTSINECMFYIILDATSFESIQSLIDHIESLRPTFTYAIIHQQKDGEGNYDIFLLSQFSYLEHCNRVKAPKQYLKNRT